ncbi:MAG: cytochrome c oxidase subunit II [Acidobacteria bacterium]|nr:cytochrome c oxidase subunit II [Acidobacteriota bacterium]
MMNLLPDAASAHAGGIDQIIVIVHWLMAILFVGWGAFFIYVLVRFRQGRNPRADYVGVKSKLSTWLEVAVAVVEAVILIGFAVPIWAERVDQRPPDEEATVVRVVAQQFAWNIWYPGADGVFGDQDIMLVDEETNPIGLVRSGNGADDITTINQMHLPVDKPAIVRISSKDVIHSFNLPQMRIKQDAIPGLQIPVWFVPTVTTAEMRTRKGDEDYNYEIACAQLCGNSHYSMRGFLTIDTPQEYQEWLDLEATYLSGGDEDDFWAE